MACRYFVEVLVGNQALISEGRTLHAKNQKPKPDSFLQAKRWRAHHPVELPHRSTSQSNLPPNILGFHPTNLPSSPPTDLQSLQLTYQHVSHLSYQPPTQPTNKITILLPYQPTIQRIYKAYS